jgi:hypothetical protein
MKGKTHQNLKADVGWKPSDGRWSVVEPSEKGKKGKDGRKAKRRGLKVNPGRAAKSTAFQVVTAESWSGIYTPVPGFGTIC